MLPLLAQFVAPPIQPGPVRLPWPGRPQLQPQPPELAPPREPATPPLPTGEPSEEPPEKPEERAPAQPLPQIKGFLPYKPGELARILAPCAAIADPDARLSSCAAAPSARLFSDGYINTRVLQAPGLLDVVEGRIVEIQVSTSSPRLERRRLRGSGQFRGLGQFDLTLHESIRGRWFGFARVSVNRSDAFLASDRFPVIPGGGQDAWLRTGFARIGLGYSGLLGPVALGGTVYGLHRF